MFGNGRAGVSEVLLSPLALAIASVVWSLPLRSRITNASREYLVGVDVSQLAALNYFHHYSPDGALTATATLAIRYSAPNFDRAAGQRRRRRFGLRLSHWLRHSLAA